MIFSLDSHVHINLKTMWKKYIQHLLGIDTKDKQRAIRIRRRLSIFYAFLGWNCFGLAFYVILKDKIPTDSTERRKSYRLLTGVPDNMHVLQVSGLKVTKEFDINYKNEEEKEAAEIEKATTKVEH
ncbi:uncharacterized protein LOC115239360 [Formica exsecta]|uniref:uncharacterized protein LOC115239360 n=1 Tax=Formica exsecta TaxID=72781 RepID=UPI0011431F61|nr:uncharacterized protein LOC115239360 [Formica exsecta]